MNQTYLDTARLLTQVAPLVFADDTFALKGGTAINLFIRDIPRLSVDLDLVFRDHTLSRDVALDRINAALRQSAERLNELRLETRLQKSPNNIESKLFVRRLGIEVKIEVNLVMRGTIHPVRASALTSTARDLLLADLTLPVLSLEDLYGGKLVAAMDRQHPRDLFDVMQLFEHEGITPGIRRAFVVYLASHNRPVHEVLFPNPRDTKLELEYERSFKGMTIVSAELAALQAARTRMCQELQDGLDEEERDFLISLVEGHPQWQKLGIAHLEALPGVRWKLQNLQQLKNERPRKFAEQVQLLTQRLR